MARSIITWYHLFIGLCRLTTLKFKQKLCPQSPQIIKWWAVNSLFRTLWHVTRILFLKPNYMWTNLQSFVVASFTVLVHYQHHKLLNGGNLGYEAANSSKCIPVKPQHRAKHKSWLKQKVHPFTKKLQGGKGIIPLFQMDCNQQQIQTPSAFRNSNTFLSTSKFRKPLDPHAYLFNLVVHASIENGVEQIVKCTYVNIHVLWKLFTLYLIPVL